MSNYTKTTDFAAKDALLTGNPSKLVKGTEINVEFSNIQTAVNSKLDSSGVTAFAATLLDDANAATARATLGSTTVGDAVFVAANAATARTALGALGVSDTIASATTAGALNAASTLPNLTLATTQTLTDSSTRVCTTAFAQGISLGSGQTWQDLTGTRAFNTTYTNSTARTITVATTTATVGNFDITAVVGGVSISQSAGVFTTVADRGTLLFHVPPSATYRVNSTMALAIWAELI